MTHPMEKWKTRTKALLCSACQFSWYKYSLCGRFQATKVMSLNTELGREELVGTCFRTLPSRGVLETGRSHNSLKIPSLWNVGSLSQENRWEDTFNSNTWTEKDKRDYTCLGEKVSFGRTENSSLVLPNQWGNKRQWRENWTSQESKERNCQFPVHRVRSLEVTSP